MLIAGALAGLVMLKAFWIKIKALIIRLLGKNND